MTVFSVGKRYNRPIMALNVILKSFEGKFEPEIAEHTLKEFDVSTCISIVWTEDRMPNIKADKHIWVSGKNQKAGRYPDMDWNKITPLDEELIESMALGEKLFMSMVKRFKPDEISYEERKRQYYDHLRYWNHILETEKIDVMICSHIPHMIFDAVLTHLCKIKGIPVLILERCYVVDHFFMTESWVDSAIELKKRIVELEKQYSDPNIPIKLSPKVEESIRIFSTQEGKPWFMIGRQKHMWRSNFVAKWAGIGFSMLIHKPAKLLSYVVRPSFWRRKLREHTVVQFYDKHTAVPDLTQPYVYVPFQMQPEMSSCPMAGAYEDQQLIVHLLRWCLPDNVRIYIKEHPEQSEWFRSTQFYEELLSIPNVYFMPRTFSTFELMKSAKAVVTSTGTVGFESLLREIPVILMGHRFYMYHKDVNCVHNLNDMKTAIDNIFMKGKRPDKRNMRILLKAVEELAGPTTVGTPQSEFMPHTKAEQAAMMGTYIAQRVRDVTRKAR